MQSLEAAKKWLRARVSDGARCPCCNRFAKVYKLRLNTNMARFLISLARHKDEWVHYRECDFVGRDYPWIRLWNLAETYKSDEPKKNMSGYWRITDAGRDFVLDKITVPKHVYAYDGDVLEVSEEQVRIRDSLGDGFNYEELIAGVIPVGVTLDLFSGL